MKNDKNENGNEPRQDLVVYEDVRQLVRLGDEKIGKALRIHRIQDNLNQGAMLDVLVGGDLLFFEKTETRKEFTRMVEEDLELHIRSARRYMTIAQMLIDHPKMVKSIKMGKTKLYALAALPAKELEEYEEKGKIWGLDEKKLTAMTTREMQDALKSKDKKIEKLEKQKEAGQEQLKGKDRQIEGLEVKLKGQFVSGDQNKVIEDLSDVRFNIHREIDRLIEKINWQMSEITINEAAGTMEVLRSAADDLFDRFTDELKGLRKKGLFKDVVPPVLGHTRELKYTKDMREKAASLTKPGKGDN